MLRPETLDKLTALGTTEEQLFHALRQVFPNGHPEFLAQTVAEMELHSVKNHDYASGGTALGNFDRVATLLAQYPGLNLGDRRVYALVLALKQVDAVLWGLCQNIEHKVEGLNSRLDDISVYAKIVKCMNIDLAREKAELLAQAQKAKLAEEERFNASYPHGRRERIIDNDIKELTLSEVARPLCPEFNKTRDAGEARGYLAGEGDCAKADLNSTRGSGGKGRF